MTIFKTVEAVVDDEGKVRVLRPVHLGSSRRALVVILDEPGGIGDETALLNEGALAVARTSGFEVRGSWSRPEEDAAWSHAQSAK